MKKQEITNIKDLLKEIVNCLNQIPNTKVNSEFVKTSYELITEIEKYERKVM